MSKALDYHEMMKGKITVKSRCKIESADDMTLAYTPGVAEPCLEIAKDHELSYKYTRRSNLIAVVTDGSAVLGLGNIGALAGMPVMEGKCALFDCFAEIDAFPIIIESQQVDVIVDTVKNIAGGFAGINLEDISAPRCFEVENRLKKILNIPVFHDDQHGTAIVVCAALTNALKVAAKHWQDVKIVVIGAGAAGTAIAKLLMNYNPNDIILCDKKGIINIHEDWLNDSQIKLAKSTNKRSVRGVLKDAIAGADVVIGVSGPNTLTKEMVASMADKSIVFAMSNPNPEIMPQDAIEGGAFIVGTGRSDYPNQINNVLAFPGIFRGALDSKATAITENMKLAAVKALSDIIPDEEMNVNNILPKAFDKRAVQAVSMAVAKQAVIDNVIRDSSHK